MKTACLQPTFRAVLTAFRGLLLVVLASVCVTGCAGWAPWKDKEQMRRNEEKYGPTADQRIKTLKQQVKAAKGGSSESQLVFTQELIQQMLDQAG